MKKLIWVLIAILGFGVCAVAYSLIAGIGDDNTNPQHVHNYDIVISNGNNTHNKICSNDNTHVITENCNGGMATCTQKAVCDVCNTEYGEYIKHEFYNEIFVITGCNYNVNYHAKICKYCLGTFDIESGNVVVHPHSWVLAESIAPTCTQMGYNAHFKCELCDVEVLGEVVAPLGHKESGNYYDNGLNHYRYCSRTDCGVKVYGQHKYDWTVLEYPTCTTNGNKAGECSLCSHETQEEIIGDHVWNSGEIILEPKCTTIGEKLCTCIICGETKKTEIDPLGHNWDNGEIIKKATCYEPGEKLYKCLRCGEEEQRNYGPEHNWKTIVVNEKTCYKDGEIYYKCIDCGLEKTEIIQAGHGDIIKEEKYATCLEWGYYKEICSICDAVIKEGYLKPLGHNLNISYDEEFHWHKCSRCDYQENKEEHLLTLKAITETIDDGTQVLYKHGLFDVCTYDGCEYKKQYGEWKLSVHYAVEIIKSNLATCTESGFTPGLKCAVNGCGEILVEQEESLPLGHNWYRGNCQRCGETQLEMQLSSDGTYYTVKSQGSFKGENLEIPSTYKGLNVTSIGDYAFRDCTSLTSIEIPDSVISICDSAFYACSSLISIEIPNSVTNIGESAFEYCTSLTSIVIPNSVVRVGDRAFEYCSSLASIKIINSVTQIGKRAFYDTEYYNNKNNWENGVLYIGTHLIRAQVSFSYAIKEGTISIADYAFEGCGFLTSVEIPNSITNIGHYAFGHCYRLVEVYNKSNLNITNTFDTGYVGNYALAIYTKPYTSKLSVDSDGYIIYSDGTEKILIGYIGNGTSLILPEGITEINRYAFSIATSSVFINYSPLISIVIPNSVTSIGGYAFEYCSSLKKVIIENGVSDIGYRAFYGCSSLENILIPDSVRSIDGEVFNGCSKLFVEKDNIKYVRVSGNEYFMAYEVTDKNLSNYTLQDNTRFLEKELFVYCERINSIIIPDRVIGIGDYAFYDCKKLTNVTIGESVESIGYGFDAFYQCYQLVEVYNKSNLNITIGSSDHGHVGKYALNVYTQNSGSKKISTDSNGYIVYNDYDEKLLVGYSGDETDLILPNNITSIYKNTFEDCDYLTSIEIPSSVTSIGSFAFHNCSSLISVIFEENSQLTSIGNSVFSGCTSLESIINMNSVTQIGSRAFYDTGYYKNENNWENGVLYISNHLIEAKDSISGSYVIKEGTITIADQAFSDCELITNIIVPNSVISIGEAAFWDCISLMNITMGNSVESISKYAFYNCDSLTSIEIPDSVRSIGYSAFEDCRLLTSITFKDTSTWCRTTNYSNWQNKTGGIETNLTKPTTNATYFKDTYDNYYWYKL